MQERTRPTRSDLFAADRTQERVKPTRSGLFAIELLISVGIFSLCAAICVGLFVRAEVISRDSADLNRAVTEARGAAECFKAAGGDLEETARLTGGRLVDRDVLFLEYDADWNRPDSGAESTYVLMLLTSRGDGYVSASLSVRWTDTNEHILDWDIAVLEGAP